MKPLTLWFAAVVLLNQALSQAQEIKLNIPYADQAHERQVLDVYTPPNAKKLPVVFWIHGYPAFAIFSCIVVFGIIASYRK